MSHLSGYELVMFIGMPGHLELLLLAFILLFMVVLPLLIVLFVVKHVTARDNTGQFDEPTEPEADKPPISKNEELPRKTDSS
jgi:cytoskeletal protein RodZ